MFSTSKTIIWIVVAVVVIGGIWWYVSMQNGNNGTGSPAAQNGTTNTQAGANNPASNLSQGNSNQDLTSDMGQIDAQMSGLASDSANVNAGVNSSTGN